jgi:hypothetical protein
MVTLSQLDLREARVARGAHDVTKPFDSSLVRDRRARRVLALGSACAGEHSAGLTKLAALGGSPTCTAYLADVEDDFHLDADTATPGSSPAIGFDMFIPGFATRSCSRTTS